MVDSAMFYLIGTLYPLVARATYAALCVPAVPGRGRLVRRRRRREGGGAAGRRGGDRRAARRLPRLLPGRQAVHRRRLAVDRRHPPRRDARVPARDRLRLPGLGRGVHGRDGGGARRRLLRAGRRRARLHRVREVAGRLRLRESRRPRTAASLPARPLGCAVPRSANSISEPTTRSLTVLETTGFRRGPAAAITRAPDVHRDPADVVADQLDPRRCAGRPGSRCPAPRATPRCERRRSHRTGRPRRKTARKAVACVVDLTAEGSAL